MFYHAYIFPLILLKPKSTSQIYRVPQKNRDYGIQYDLFYFSGSVLYMGV